MKYTINKKNNYSQLRLLFPELVVADKVPIYSKVVFSLFDYDDYGKIDLLLVQDKSGVNVDTIQGLCKFLTDIKYMAQSKIDRLRKVSSFGPSDKVYAMYHEAISLKVSNRSYLEPDLNTDLPPWQIWTMPLNERLDLISLIDAEVFLTESIKTLERYFTRDSTMSATVYKEISKAVLNFDILGFRDKFKLTGDFLHDSFLFLTYFGL